MTVLSEAELDAFIKRKSSGMNGILIHGDSVSGLAQQVLRAVVGSSDAAFATVRIDVGRLKDEPGLLDDEFRSLSLLGERRVVVADGVGDSHMKALTPILASRDVGNFVLLLGESLGKSSKLRSACEAADKFGCLAVYEETSAALRDRIRKQLAVEKLNWGPGAEDMFFELVGSERATTVQEALKLSIYCLGQSQITESDVEAVCGNTIDFGTDQLIDAVLAGDLSGADRMSSNLDADSAGVRGSLAVLSLHLTRLQSLRMEMDRGQNAEQTLRNARPPIFFKRRNTVMAQLRSFDLPALLTLQQSVAEAVLLSRKMPDLSEAITNRTLLALARSARSKLN